MIENMIMEMFKYHETVNSENLAIFLIAMVSLAVRNGLIKVRAQMIQIEKVGLGKLLYDSSSPRTTITIAPRLTPMIMQSKHFTISLRMK